MLGEGRKDESGDVTKGAGLDGAQIQTVLSVFEVVEDTEEKIAQIDLYLRDSKVGQEGREELEQIDALVRSSGLGSDRIVIDPSIVRSLEYYTGPVYEAELIGDIKDGFGRPVRIGSVGEWRALRRPRRSLPRRAGASDGNFDRRLTPARGGCSFSARSTASRSPARWSSPCSTRRASPTTSAVTTLRNAGIRAELYLGGGKMGPQLKYADKRGSPCVIIQGGDEQARGEVQIKDLIEGAKAAAAIASNQEWRESRPAQFAVTEDKLVDAVREVLARHGVTWN